MIKKIINAGRLYNIISIFAKDISLYILFMGLISFVLFIINKGLYNCLLSTNDEFIKIICGLFLLASLICFILFIIFFFISIFILLNEFIVLDTKEVKIYNKLKNNNLDDKDIFILLGLTRLLFGDIDASKLILFVSKKYNSIEEFKLDVCRFIYKYYSNNSDVVEKIKLEIKEDLGKTIDLCKEDLLKCREENKTLKKENNELKDPSRILKIQLENFLINK